MIDGRNDTINDLRAEVNRLRIELSAERERAEKLTGIQYGRIRLLPSRLSCIDPRPWVGVKRWPSKAFVKDLNSISGQPLVWPTMWIIGLGWWTLTIHPKAIKEKP